jgi:hypothetical protein
MQTEVGASDMRSREFLGEGRQNRLAQQYGKRGAASKQRIVQRLHGMVCEILPNRDRSIAMDTKKPTMLLGNAAQ